MDCIVCAKILMQSLFNESCISPLTAESGVRYAKGAEIGKINVVFISMNV